MGWNGDLGGLGIWVGAQRSIAVGGSLELGVDGQGDAWEGDGA